MITWYSRTKRPLNIRIDLSAGFLREVVRRRVVFEVEFRPDDEVDNPLVETIWPVIPQDLDILLLVLERLAFGRYG
jgi:hypothetical protein